MFRSVWTLCAVLVLLLPVAPGCGADGVPPSVTRSAPGLTLTVRADPALVGEVEAAAARWSAATGVHIALGDAGPEFVLEPVVLRPDGSEAPAATSADRQRVRVSARTGARQRASTTLHELGHVLGGDHTDTDGVLGGSKDRTDRIDAAALETVCARLSCAWLSPE